MAKTRYNPGKRLRATRWESGFSLRDVHRASIRLADRLGNPKFILPPSRLHNIELKNSIPSIHRIYTLARVYGRDIRELWSWYGVPKR